MTDHHSPLRSAPLPPPLDSMTVLVGAVIVHDRAADRVVLLRHGPHARSGRQGMWDLPMGKSEPGEPITDTAVRELYEETGLRVRPEALRVAHIVHGARNARTPNGYLTVVFAADEWTGEPENREPGKHAEVRWAEVDALPGEFVRSSAEALHRYLADGPLVISLVGWSP